MTVTRISTFNTHQSTLSDAASVQNRLFILQNQVSSGLKADTFKDLNGRVESFAAVDNRLKRTDLFLQQNTLLGDRLRTMSTVMDQVVDISGDFKNLLVLAKSETNRNSLAFEERLNGLWGAFAGQLNTNMDGRYLFSGTKTDVPPLDPDTYPSLVNGDTPDSGYYNGASENQVFRVQDDYEITQSVRADDPTFQKIAAAFSLAKEAQATGDDTKLDQAFTYISDAIKGATDIQAVINTNMINVEGVNDKLSSLKLYWKGVKESMVNTDLISASTEIAMNQATLQASFQAFARINQLKLSDYLR